MSKNISIKIEGGKEWASKIKDVLQKYANHEAHVGVLGGTYDDGTSIALVGAEHEFGSFKERIFNYKGKTIKIKGYPSRSWARVPLHRAGKKILGEKGMIKKMIELDCQHGYTGVALKYMGNNGKELMRQEFLTSGQGTWPRNMSAEYVEAKGHDTPLRDGDTLMNSIDSEVVKGQ